MNEDSAFERWRKRASYLTGLGNLSREERESMRLSDCEQRKNELLSTSPILVFLSKHLALSGCALKEPTIRCVPCELTHAGGFVPEPGVIQMCAGNFLSTKHMEATMAHEMIHLYDHCRFGVDWENLRHHACSEIRANSLSGDCRFTREFRRGKLGFSKNHQGCVRRRAIQSVSANPKCPNAEAAEKAVNEVFESCFKDTRPFDEIY